MRVTVGIRVGVRVLRRAPYSAAVPLRVDCHLRLEATHLEEIGRYMEI